MSAPFTLVSCEDEGRCARYSLQQEIDRLQVVEKNLTLENKHLLERLNLPEVQALFMLSDKMEPETFLLPDGTRCTRIPFEELKKLRKAAGLDK